MQQQPQQRARKRPRPTAPAMRPAPAPSPASPDPPARSPLSADATVCAATECASGLQRLPRCGSADREAWARRRARCLSSSEMIGRGNADGSRVALRREGCATVICSGVSCCALVHLHSARRRAGAAGRVDFEAGDGCAGPRCSSNYRPGQFHAAQQRMAAALSAGERFLVPWPTNCADSDLWYHAEPAAAAAATAALAAIPHAAATALRPTAGAAPS